MLLMRLARRIASQEVTDGFFPTLLRTGYVVGKRKGFTEMFGRSIELDRDFLARLFNLEDWPLSPVEGISLMCQFGSTWPTSTGSPLRFTSDAVYIDLESCYVLLDLYSDFGLTQKDGPVVNVRASHFEDAVQSVISASPWAPSPDAKSARGRTLTRSGRAVTDVDALGENGSSLLLVSVKSFPFTWEYARGGYNAVRNVESNVLKAAKEWGLLINQFRSDPVGDNFNFSKYSNIMGAVVLPFAPYLSDNFFSDAAFDLPPVYSLGELDVFLNRS
ncbi:hypothetical protein [Micromonospora sp. NPDC049107]|uniref:hypothetical protein n=1 Tax=Micromonospora sp. NPDC049107 TaxID=3154349 RepID=UPI003405D8E2